MQWHFVKKITGPSITHTIAASKHLLSNRKDPWQNTRIIQQTILKKTRYDVNLLDQTSLLKLLLIVQM